MKHIHLILLTFFPGLLFAQSTGNPIQSNGNNKLQSNSGQYRITEFFSYDGESSSAHANNNFGAVVGLTSFNGFNSAIMVKNGVVTYLDPNEYGFNSQAINEADKIAGISNVGGKYFHAAMWENGTITDLDAGVENYSWANAINNTGQVVGYRGLGRYS